MLPVRTSLPNMSNHTSFTPMFSTRAGAAPLISPPAPRFAQTGSQLCPLVGGALRSAQNHLLEKTWVAGSDVS